jgi:TorA maturation chaperone TorD
MTQAPISSAGLDEETARAELYGLLALVYYAPIAPDLIAQLRVAVTEAPAAGGFLEEPWRALVGVAREMDDTSIAAEYTTLFGGVGKPEVYLFGSFYLSGFLNEKPLAALRADIAELGLARDDAMSETEDVAVSNLTHQQAFFATHVQPWALRMCDALQAHPKARFYAAVAGLTRAFVEVEAQGFDMLG